MPKGFTVWTTLKGKDAASKPIVTALGHIRVAGLRTGKVLRGALNLGGKALAFGGLGGVGGLLGAGMLLKTTKHLVDSQAELLHNEEKVASRMGMSIGQFQKWQYTAYRAADMGADEFSTSLRGLLPVLGQVETGIGRGAAIIKKFSPSLTAALKKSKSPAQSLGIIMDALGNKTVSYTKRVALANKIFGESGAKWTKVAEQGKPAIKGMMDQAEKYGLNTEQGVHNVEAWEEAHKNLEASVLGLKRAIGETLLPTFTSYTESLAGWLADHKTDIAGWIDKGAKAALDFAERGIPKLVSAFESARPAFKVVGDTVGVIVDGLKAIDKFQQWAGTPRVLNAETARGNAATDEAIGKRVRSKYDAATIGMTAARIGAAPDSPGYWGAIATELSKERVAKARQFDASSPFLQAVRGQSVSGTVRLQVSAAPGFFVSADATDVEGPVEFTPDVGTPAVFGGAP